MKEFKGTKGEWDWEGNSASLVDGSTCIEVHSGGGPQIAYLQSFDGWGADYERNATIANAHLIAAAPDLLEALQNATRVLEAGKNVKFSDWIETIQKSKAAISKALGEE